MQPHTAKASHGQVYLGIAMNSLKFGTRRSLPAGVAATLLLLTPMIVADADSTLAPAQAHYVENLLGQHDARYILSTFGRVPLQCAPEMHGA
jgi:hypothetical protein